MEMFSHNAVVEVVTIPGFSQKVRGLLVRV